MPSSLFVYGTLLPGERNWHLLKGEVASWQPARLSGWCLWDLPAHNYPAITPLASASVQGALLELVELERALKLCDALEGYEPGDLPGSLYWRVQAEVCAQQGEQPAWVYVWNAQRLDELCRRAQRVQRADWRMR